MFSKKILSAILTSVSVVILTLLVLFGHSYYFGEYNYMYIPQFDLADYEEYLNNSGEFEIGPYTHKLTEINLGHIPNSRIAVQQAKCLWTQLTGLDFLDAQVSVAYCLENQCWLIEEEVPRWPISRSQDWIGILFGAIVDKDGNVIAVWYN